MASSLYVDGVARDPQQPLLPFAAAALRQGVGLFETIRVYRGQPFLLPAHLDRIDNGCALFHAPSFRERFVADWREIHESKFEHDGVLRLYALAGDSQRSWIPVTSFESASFKAPHAFHLRSGASVSLSRFGPGMQPKTTSYAAAALARSACDDDGLSAEPCFVSVDGAVLETATANVFLRCENVLKTPSLSLGILPGCTRAWVIARAAALGYSVEEGIVSTRDLETADEVFLTSALKECAPVASVDGVARELSRGASAVAAFLALIGQEVSHS